VAGTSFCVESSRRHLRSFASIYIPKSHILFLYHKSEQCSLIIFVSNLQLTRQTVGPSHIHGRNWCSAQDSWLNACLGPGLFAAVFTHCTYFLWVFRLFLFCDEVDWRMDLQKRQKHVGDDSYRVYDAADPQQHVSLPPPCPFLTLHPCFESQEYFLSLFISNTLSSLESSKFFQPHFITTIFCVVNPFHVCRISNRLTTHRKIAGIFFPPGFYCFNVNLKIDNSYWILTNLRVDNRPVGGCTDPSRRGGWYGSVP